MDLLEGKVDNKHKYIGAGIILVAIILIVLAICTNFFGSDTNLFYANKVVRSGDTNEEEYLEDEEEKKRVPNFSGEQDTSIGYESGYIPATLKVEEDR